MGNEATCKVCGMPAHFLPGACAIEHHDWDWPKQSVVYAERIAQLENGVIQLQRESRGYEAERDEALIKCEKLALRVAELEQKSELCTRAWEASQEELADAKQALAEFRDFRKRVQDLDRVNFIRQAAVALYPLEQLDSWKRAKELWAAKPEDC